MILPRAHHSWPEAKQNSNRTLPPPRLHTAHDQLRKDLHQFGLEDLAEAATRQLNISTPRSAASLSLSEYALCHKPRTSCETQTLRLPSFRESFSNAIAAADRLSPSQDDQIRPCQALEPRGRSPGSEYSWQGSVPGLSPLSTAHNTPVVSPITPSYNIPSQSQLEIQILLNQSQSEQQRQKQHLALVRSRRTTSEGFDISQPRRVIRTSRQSGKNGSGGGEKKRHFNQKYKNPDKHFIVFHKDDLKWGWPAIQARRLELLPYLLGHDYDRAVEEAREVAGLNGMYYRENDLNMPVLTPDGSGLVFVEKDGRWWECTRSQKVYDRNVKKGCAGWGRTHKQPRGMCERYPEEVLLYWDDHVRHFVPEDKRDEVYAKARKYSEIRAEQRRQHGVPQWSLDNKEERVLDLNPPKTPAEASARAKAHSKRVKRS